MSIIQRARTFYLRKRVPRRYQGVEPREFAVISLHTDSKPVAESKAPQVWADLIEAWEARLAGDTDDAEQRLEAARNLAAAKGYRFMRAREVAKLPLAELRDRLAAARGTAEREDLDVMAADALLGTAPTPAVKISKVLESYWTLARDRIIGKSEDQVRRWKNPRLKAFVNFEEAVDDKEIADITTEDLFEFREWWLDRIQAEGLTPNSANKDLIHLTSTLKTVARAKSIKLAFNTDGLMLKDGEKRQRPPFSTAWIKEKLLKEGALGGLNAEARCILLGMINTGYRPSEAQCLTAAQIRLDVAVPHISIEPVGRTLKSPYARRVIPLLGVSLEAFKQFPDGFDRYREKASLSATVNKYLRENKLVETDGHTLYSLRHSFEDRMLAAGIDDRIRRDLFGHRLTRERYGQGASLEQLRDLMKPLAL